MKQQPKKAKSEVPWTVWRLDLRCRAAACQCCGYFWGPEHDRAGQRCEWQAGASPLGRAG